MAASAIQHKSPGHPLAWKGVYCCFGLVLNEEDDGCEMSGVCPGLVDTKSSYDVGSGGPRPIGQRVPRATPTTRRELLGYVPATSQRATECGRGSSCHLDIAHPSDVVCRRHCQAPG